MKFLIINSFRIMVYVAYIAIIVGGIALGLYNKGEFSNEMLGLTGALSQVADFAIFTAGGWIATSMTACLTRAATTERSMILGKIVNAAGAFRRHFFWKE